MKYKLFFDIEGTLVDSVSSWVDLHKAFGTIDIAIKYYKDWLYHQNAHLWAQNDVKLFKGKTYEDIMVVLHDIEFYKGVFSMFPSIMDKYDVYLITGGFGLFVESIASQLSIPYGKLIYHRIYAEKDEWKVDDIRSFNDKSVIKEYDGFKIAIGNGYNDIGMFKEADIAIGVNLDPKKRDEIIPYIDKEFTNIMEVLTSLLYSDREVEE